MPCRSLSAASPFALRGCGRKIPVGTNGRLTAVILDPSTGEIVGGSTRPQGGRSGPRTTEPAETIRIPLLVGTARFDLERGYTLPAGNWNLAVPMNLRGGRKLMSAPLSFAITEPGETSNR